eukprot:PhM_4_TR15201/c0_g1_i1/m.106647
MASISPLLLYPSLVGCLLAAVSAISSVVSMNAPQWVSYVLWIVFGLAGAFATHVVMRRRVLLQRPGAKSPSPAMTPRSLSHMASLHSPKPTPLGPPVPHSLGSEPDIHFSPLTSPVVPSDRTTGITVVLVFHGVNKPDALLSLHKTAVTMDGRVTLCTGGLLQVAWSGPNHDAMARSYVDTIYFQTPGIHIVVHSKEGVYLENIDFELVVRGPVALALLLLALLAQRLHVGILATHIAIGQYMKDYKVVALGDALCGMDASYIMLVYEVIPLVRGCSQEVVDYNTMMLARQPVEAHAWTDPDIQRIMTIHTTHGKMFNCVAEAADGVDTVTIETVKESDTSSASIQTPLVRHHTGMPQFVLPEVESGETWKWRTTSRGLGTGRDGEVLLGYRADNAHFGAVKRCAEHQDMISAPHPHIIQCLGRRAEDDDGTTVYVFEFMAGGSLDGLVDLVGPLPPLFCREVMRQISSALSFMHTTMRLCHADVKPHNVLFDGTNMVKLADFGCVTPPRDNTQLIEGTTHFMAPERGSGVVSFEGDMWGLGVAIYYLSTGRLPYTEEQLSLPAELFIVQLCRGDIEPSLRGMPKEVDRYVVHCLQRDRTKRVSAAQLCDLLTTF